MDGIVFRATVTSFLQWKIADFKNEAIFKAFKLYHISVWNAL